MSAEQGSPAGEAGLPAPYRVLGDREAADVTRDEAMARAVVAVDVADQLVHSGSSLDAVRIEALLAVSYGWAMVADRPPPAAGDGR